MAERQAAHEDRNLARMLTPAERRWAKSVAAFAGCVEQCCVDRSLHRLRMPAEQYKV